MSKARSVRERNFLRFAYRTNDQGARSVQKNGGQALSNTDRAKEVNKEFIMWCFGWFPFPFLTGFLSWEVAVYLTS